MARIPFTLAQVPDVNARSLGGSVDTPQVANRGLGESLLGFSDNLQRGADAADDFAHSQRLQSTASLTAASSFTPQYLTMRQSAPPGAQGFTQQVSQGYDQHVAAATDGIEDPLVRMAVKRNLLERKQSYVDQAADFEVQSNAQNQRNVAGVALGSITNNFRSVVQQTPSGAHAEYQRALQDSGTLIDSLPGIDANTRTAMKVSQLHGLTSEYAQGVLMSAQDSGQLQQAQQLLDSPLIKNNMDANGYQALQRFSWVQARRFARQEGAGLDSAVGSINQRIDQGVAVSPDEIRDIESSPALARNPGAQFRLSEAKAKMAVNATYGSASISDLRVAAEDNMKAASAGGAPSMVSDVPPKIASAITSAASATGCSPAYLAALTHNEYGGLLSSNDFGRGPVGGGSARGVGQIQPGTWLDLVKGNADAFGEAMQPPVSGAELTSRGDQALLALRADPALNLMGAGLYAQQNRAVLSQTLGRPANDAETYTAHVLGTAGGARFLQAVQNNPDANVEAVVGADAARANKGFFYDRNGAPLSCQQAYSAIAARFANSPARASFVKAQQLQRLLRTAVQRYSADPAAYAIQQNAARPLTEDPASWAQRGKDVAAFAQTQGGVGLNGKRLPPMQPFTNQEAQTYAAQMANPDVPTDQKLSTLARVQQFADPAIVRAAYRQIGVKDPVAGRAGQLMNATGDAGAAHDILEGRAHISRNPNILTAMNVTPDSVNTAYNEYVGSALSALGADPSGRDPMGVTQDAATAHYTQRVYGLGTGNSASDFSPDKYKDSLDAALGGTQQHKAIQMVNGSPTLMPANVNAEDIQSFLSKATPADLVRVSANGQAPQYLPVNGHASRVIPPSQLQHATLRARGGGYFEVIPTAGFAAVSGAGVNGVAPRYYMKLTPETMQRGASGLAQPVAPAQPDRFGGLPEAKADDSVAAPAAPEQAQRDQTSVADEMADQQIMNLDN